jgi:hypothetical protein
MNVPSQNEVAQRSAIVMKVEAKCVQMELTVFHKLHGLKNF